jgi:peptidoglycan endopeptidase LytE
VNPNINNPIPPGTRVRIPTIKDSPPKQQNPIKQVKVKQHIDIAPSIITLGRRLRGTPYKFGAGPYPRSRRFDCSSYLQYIFGRNGVKLPRNSRAQARVGRFITLRDVEPGDLLFFRRDRYSDNRIGHVGVDIGGGRMLNTYKSPPGVTISRWRSPFWLKRHITTREIL